MTSNSSSLPQGSHGNDGRRGGRGRSTGSGIHNIDDQEEHRLRYAASLTGVGRGTNTLPPESSQYHNLPEISWNAEMFNFDPQDFSALEMMSDQYYAPQSMPNPHLNVEPRDTSTTPNPNVPMTMGTSMSTNMNMDLHTNMNMDVSTSPYMTTELATQIAQHRQARRLSPIPTAKSRSRSVASNTTTTSTDTTSKGKGKERISKPKIQRPCQHCGKTFTRSYDLHRHESSHSSERPYACEHPGCTKKYKLRQDLKAHERSAHEGRGGGGAVVLGYWQGHEDRLYSM